MKYYITTFCYGAKYEPVRDKWSNRIMNKCKNSDVIIFNDISILNNTLFEPNFPGYIWAIRLKHNLNLLSMTNKPIVMCDLDVIIEKDIQPIVELPFDIIISTEIGGNNAYPKECSEKLGFGACCGFMILKKSSLNFVYNIFKNMESKKYKTYNDQINFMKYIVDGKYNISEKDIILDNKKYTNKIIHIDNIKICVLDFDIITRDPIITNGQFGNHINIDNVGGVFSYLRYFNEVLETLPLTCRCGKKHLGDNNECKHLKLRNNII